MSTGRRLAKRSILGTRVSAPGQDGRYHPAVIQAVKTSGGDGDAESVYGVLFDDGRTVKELRESELVGPGFRAVGSVRLRPGQRVFATHNGREVSAAVLRHWPDGDEVTIRVAGGGPDLAKRLDEVRLLESRKSARLHDQDQDYSRLADVGPTETLPPPAQTTAALPTRKRLVSHVIDVPAAQSNRKRRPSSPDGDTDTMNDCNAAMVLMSLSCSPKSPRLPNYISDTGLQFPQSWAEYPCPQSPLSSSGASSWNSSSAKSQQSGVRTPSPLSLTFGLSESAPASLPVMRLSTLTSDEGIETDESMTSSNDDYVPRKRRNSTKTVFQCTWPGCGKTAIACSTMEKHVRISHLGGKEQDNSDYSDHEEEFYYTEVEIGLDSVTDSFANMYTSSPPTLSHMDMARPPHEDPEYLKQVQNSPQKLIRLSPKSVSSIIKPIALHRKARGDSKKCRKVYGMENRDQWCTQCKWKKACSRFID